MIQVRIEKENAKYKKIKIIGHAMYDDYGKDIVCAGVSSVIITSVNAILTFNKNYLIYSNKEDLFTIKVLEHNDIVDNILLNMVNMLVEIENNYPKNIKIRKEN